MSKSASSSCAGNERLSGRVALPVLLGLVILTAIGCRDRTPPLEQDTAKPNAAKQAEVTGTTEVTASTAATTASTTGGPNCSAAGDPTVGVDTGYSCTGALAAATFTHALCACATIQDSNSLTTDAFDSSKGGPTGGLGGDVAANTSIAWSTASSIGGTLWTPGNLNSSNSSTVRGDLRLGGTLSGSGTFTVNGNAYVIKTLPAFAKVLGTTNKVTSVATPCSCSNQVPVASITAAHRAPNNDDTTINLSPTAYVGNNPTTLDLPCGNYYLTQINAAQPLTIKVHGHSSLHVDGNLQASQTLAFQFDTGATLDLFVAGTFYAAQTLTLGSAARPENCRVFVAGASFVTSGSAAYGCNVYAPNALITLANNIVVSGSIFAKDIQVSGNATVHYDTSILGAGSECCSAATCDDGNPCTADSCNGDGTCAHTPVANGTTCNDANGCTQTDTCQAGACTGANPVVCAASDQCHGVGTCNSATGTCSNPTLANGTTCNDGNGCTQSDTCQSGTCTGGNPVTCSASDQCHDPGTCSPTTGQCSTPAKTDGTTCNDGNACTQSDTCQSGICTGSNPIVCAAADQCHESGTCSPTTGQCTAPPKTNGTTCNDGNACTQLDTCQSGTCTGSNPVVCTAADQCHDPGTCNSTTGQCSTPAKPNGATCNDGNACTQTDTCQSGSCTGSNPVACAAADQCHDPGTCSPTTGQCSAPAKADGTTCNDGDACTQTDTCKSGSCIGGNPVACAAADQCHDLGTCNSATGQCTTPAKANGTTCNDGNACTRTDTCQSGSCTGSNAVTCAASDQCHDVGVCDPTSGSCSNPAKIEGTLCDDGNACTRTDNCHAGNCVGTHPITCTAADQCHDAGQCDSTSGSCSNPAKPDGTQCNDGNACTQVDSCQTGVCNGSNAVACVALDQCHVVGSCDPASGQCSNPPKPNGTACTDNNACTRGDLCQSGSCQPGAPVAIDDNNPCTADSCDTVVGVVHALVTDGTSCSDGNPCNGTETCTRGTCMAGQAPVIDDGDPCTADLCDSVSGTVSHTTVADGASCSDGNVCNGTETCVAGNCKLGVALNVDDGNPCTADSCEPFVGVKHNITPGASCSDGNACNGAEVCDSAGTCTAGTPPTIDDGNPCTADACDLVAGVSHTPTTCNCSPGYADNGISCDPVAASLSGLRWELPCRQALSTEDCYTVSDKVSQSTTLGGTADQLYNITLRFRGEIEQESYLAGTQDGYFYTGGKSVGPPYNIYSLTTSSPNQVYFLNAGPIIRHTSLVDYTRTIQIAGGSTVVLAADSQGGEELLNRDAQNNPIVVPDISPAPQAYFGQFLQMDVIDVERVTDPLNQAPKVNAGNTQTVKVDSLPATANLTGTISDDGRPSGIINSIWSKVSGPGDVTFAAPNQQATAVTFSQSGHYVLALTGSDSQLYASSMVDVYVVKNSTLVVNAGPDVVRTLPALASLNGYAADSALPPGTQLSYQWSLENGPAPVTIATPNSLSTTVEFSQPGEYQLRLTVTEPGDSGFDELIVWVNSASSANLPPTGNAGPELETFAGVTIPLIGTASDDGLPLGSPLTTTWVASVPTAICPATLANWVVFGDPHAAATTFMSPIPGYYTLYFIISDGQYTVSYGTHVNVLQVNQAPAIALPSPIQVDLESPSHLVAAVTDDGLPQPSNLNVAWSQLSGPGTVTFSAPNQAATDATFSAVGTYTLQLTATDGELTTAVQLIVTVARTNHAPIVNAGADQNLASPIKSTTLAGTVGDDGLPEGAAVTFAWSQVSGPAVARITAPNSLQSAVNFPYPGTYVFRLSATDTALTASDDMVVTVGSPTSGAIPVVQLLTPADDDKLTKPTAITGNVSDGAWVLTYRHGGRDDADTNWRTLASGNGMTSGNLGTFDPTQLLNGTYTIKLASSTTAGQADTMISVAVDGRMKVGNFTLSFRDLDIPVGGVPFQLTRTYDSRDSRVSDFGAGWSLSIRNVRVEKASKTGAHWTQVYYDDEFFPQYCLQPTNSAAVTITMPNGRVYRFRPVASPQCQTLYPLTAADISWQNLSDPDSPTIKLAAVNQASVFVDGPAMGDVQFINSDYDVYDPRQFTLTTEDGTVYNVDQDHGLTQVQDRTGNTLQINDQGIIHSSGKSVLFQRDTLNRIGKITDPAGNALTYQYDVKGDLVAFVDRESNKTTFTYSTGHYLETIKDPLGRQPIRNEYDADGRLVKNIDAQGHEVVYTHILASNEEQIQDRLGHITLYQYNDMGDILQKSDGIGAIWKYTYDTNGNVLTAVDPLGNKTTKTYDWHGNPLSEKNALGELTSHTYNNFSQLLTTVDPLGYITINEYDPNTGTLTKATDARGYVTNYTYDTKGNRLTEKDPQGHVTTYEYDASGNPSKKTDAQSHATQTTYDSDNRKLTEVSTRAVNGTTETLTTSYQYDKNGKLTQTTLPDGSTTKQEWSTSGKRTASVDALGQRTIFTYDDADRLTTTTYPDNTTETIGYDAENHRTSRTDALSRTTSYAYDAVGRVTTTTNADNTTTVNAYDQAGNLTSTTNEAGKVTTYGYDLANRRVSTTDPLNNATDVVLDAAGHQTQVIAADGTSTHYFYDEAGELTETQFTDNSQTFAEFDELGRQVSKTDELGRKTTFGYDELGRLASVTDAAKQITKYAYDEQGNQVSQTDANGHVTLFVYDKQGRMTDRQLPDGTSEHRDYDSAGRLVTRTDFAGRATVYTYDTQGRVLTRKYPDNSLVTFVYDAAGQRKTVTDTRGVTQYGYDSRGRVSSLVYPDARELDYAYDPRGMRSTTTAKIGTQLLTTSSTFDAAGRLASVTDPLNRAYATQYNSIGNRTSLTYPNTLETDYTYDTRGRLTGLVTKEPGASGAVTQSYAYTLDSAGKRTRIEESDGTVRQYGYDSIDRLTSETVTGALAYSNVFGYDPVGNRLTETSTGSHPGTVNYGYDNRDRLTTEGSTVYAYDNNGNLTSKTGEATYTWDFENRLTRVALSDGSTVDHVYDVDGNRVQTKVTPSGGGAPTVTNYLVDTAGSLSQVVAETDGAGALTSLYVRADNELLAVVRPASASTWATRYVHVDGLGSVRVLTDETGVVADTRAYEAFGVQNSHVGSDSLAYGFAGEAFDSSSKLAYHRARWMDPGRGRFLGMDPLMGRVGNPLSLQKYLYAGDEPADSTDPSGQDYDSVSISLGTVMSGVMSTMAQAVPYALAAAITCEASLVTSFFETASSSPSQGLCKNRWFNHYTHEEGYAGILGKGQVDTSGDGYVYLTPDIYFTGATAKSRLALRRVPVGYFRIPEQDIVDITHRGTVGRANGEDGGGDEWVSPEPVAVARAVWIPVF